MGRDLGVAQTKPTLRGLVLALSGGLYTAGRPLFSFSLTLMS